MVSIKVTELSEAEQLCKIQQAAFLPLYEKYHDNGNPYLRGPQDILCRCNKQNRYFTILYEGRIVGGIFYRLYGKRSPWDLIGRGEYYLARIYIHPDFQKKGIAKEAILLCEKEFPDARCYYVDFPEDMEKNRKCYQSVGYQDTGERIRVEGAPVLAMMKKEVQEAEGAEEVRFPMVYEVEEAELSECLEVIHQSFDTVAKDFGLNRENCPKHTSFLPLSDLETQKHWGFQMYALYAGKKIIGYMSLSQEKKDASESSTVFELHHLAVLPAYRHRGFGTLLLDHAKDMVRYQEGDTIKVGMIEESAVLRDWYISNDFAPAYVKRFEHLPFTVGYLEWKG